MSNLDSFYELASTTSIACTMVKALRKEIDRTGLCNACGAPKPGVVEIDVTIQEAKPDNTPLNSVNGFSLGIARRSFLFAFGEDVVRRHLYLGCLHRNDGTPLDDWVTFHGKHRIVVRGSEHVSYRRCSECGRDVYFAMGQEYLYPAPPSGVAIFDSGNGGLVVTKELIDRVTLNKWRKLSCTKLPVLDAPKDGLPEFKNP